MKELPRFITQAIFDEIAVLASDYVKRNPTSDDVTRHVLDELGERRARALAPHVAVGQVSRSIGRSVKIALDLEFGEDAVNQRGSRKISGRFYSSYTRHEVDLTRP